MLLTRIRLTVLACLTLLASVPDSVQGVETPPGDVVKELTSAMTQQHLEAIAAADPSQPGRYIAALLIPGTQLLVVAAQYPNSVELEGLISRQAYRDVYSALHQPSTMTTRLFFLDAGCDGLQVGDDTVDVVYEKGTSEIIFDGDWKKAKVSQSEYHQRIRDAVPSSVIS